MRLFSIYKEQLFRMCETASVVTFDTFNVSTNTLKMQTDYKSNPVRKYRINGYYQRFQTETWFP